MKFIFFGKLSESDVRAYPHNVDLEDIEMSSPEESQGQQRCIFLVARKSNSVRSHQDRERVSTTFDTISRFVVRVRESEILCRGFTRDKAIRFDLIWSHRLYECLRLVGICMESSFEAPGLSHSGGQQCLTGRVLSSTRVFM